MQVLTGCLVRNTTPGSSSRNVPSGKSSSKAMCSTSKKSNASTGAYAHEIALASTSTVYRTLTAVAHPKGRGLVLKML
jgi:hypothetical protein